MQTFFSFPLSLALQKGIVGKNPKTGSGLRKRFVWKVKIYAFWLYNWALGQLVHKFMRCKRKRVKTLAAADHHFLRSVDNNKKL